MLIKQYSAPNLYSNFQHSSNTLSAKQSISTNSSSQEYQSVAVTSPSVLSKRSTTVTPRIDTNDGDRNDEALSDDVSNNIYLSTKVSHP